MKVLKRKSSFRLAIAVQTALLFSACAGLPKNEVGKEKVVFVHGYGRTTSAMNDYETYFEKQGYQVFSIGYGSLKQGIGDIQKEFETKVDQSLHGIDDKVHFVGHSMGGLMIRSYLGKKKPKNLGNVVIVGSPSRGTEAVEYLRNKWYFFLLGPALPSLSTKDSVFLASLIKPNYNLGVIAGNVSYGNRSRLFTGKNDGLVSVESTKVEGMKDFISMPESHFSLRHSEKVMKQILNFLKSSKFIKGDSVSSQATAPPSTVRVIQE